MTPKILADHNSVLQLGVDSNQPISGSYDIQPSRAQENSCRSDFGFTDAWLHAHGDCDTVFANWEPIRGYTLGDGHSSWHLRRLDRIHCPSCFSSWAKCYIFFVGGADHKAVFMDVSPPDGPLVRPHFRPNNSFSFDDEHVYKVRDRLLSLESFGPQWWEEAYNVIISASYSFN